MMIAAESLLDQNLQHASGYNKAKKPCDVCLEETDPGSTFHVSFPWRSPQGLVKRDFQHGVSYHNFSICVWYQEVLMKLLPQVVLQMPLSEPRGVIRVRRHLPDLSDGKHAAGSFSNLSFALNPSHPTPSLFLNHVILAFFKKLKCRFWINVGFGRWERAGKVRYLQNSPTRDQGLSVRLARTSGVLIGRGLC